MPSFRIKPGGTRRNGWEILNIAGVPFYVEPSFLLFIGIVMMLVVSWGMSLVQAALLCFVIFFSLLGHEGGHAMTARILGKTGVAVSLVAFGGRTYHGSATNGQSLAITSAGPGATFALAAGAWALLKYGLPDGALQGGAGFVLHYVVVLNVFWLIINLVPIFPLDGGMILFHGLVYKLGEARALVATAYVSLIFCLLGGWLAFSSQHFIILMFAFMFFMQNLEIVLASRR